MQRLIAGFDAYVNEAFGVAHRAHASIVGPPAFLPSAAGLRFAREVEVLGQILERPARPFVAVVGGAKVADKLAVLNVLATKVDTLVVGGGMAFTFLAAQGARGRVLALRPRPPRGLPRRCWPRACASCSRPTRGPSSPAARSAHPRRGTGRGERQGH